MSEKFAFLCLIFVVVFASRISLCVVLLCTSKCDSLWFAASSSFFLSFFLFLCVCVSVCFCYAHILRTHKVFFLPTCLPCGKLVAAAVALALLFLLLFLSFLAPDLFFLRCLLLILVTFLLLLLPPAAATSLLLLLLLLLALSSPSCPPPPPRPSPDLVSSVCPILEIGFSGHAITPPGESVGRRVGSRERNCWSLLEESGTREWKLVFV